ncbi:MAG: hypothetical protein JWQ71_3768 [Pedosphaera sp.]|nr:hypothetical protein [Pedosphaera sp.]
MLAMLDLRHEAARYRLGVLDTESLVRIADALLKEGRNSTAAVQLLLLESPVVAEAAPIFERMYAECGITVPTKDEAIDDLLRFHLTSITSEARPPREALHVLMKEVYFPYISNEPTRKYFGDSRDLEQLIGAYWGYDDLQDRPREVSFEGRHGAEAIALYDEHVRELARDWLQRHGRAE